MTRRALASAVFAALAVNFAIGAWLAFGLSAHRPSEPVRMPWSAAR